MKIVTTNKRAVQKFDEYKNGLQVEGNLCISRANGKKLEIKEATYLKTCNSGTGTETITNLIPAGSLVLAVEGYVVTILAGAALTTWSLGITGDTDKFATTKALAAGTTANSLTDAAADSLFPYIQKAAVNVLLTAAAGVFSSGVVRVTVHYATLTPATS